MPIVYLLIAAAAIVIAIFALQNADQVTVRFLAWQIERAPLAAVILISGAAGAILVSLIGFIQRWKLSAKVRQLEARLRSLEASQPESGTLRPE
ncbi:MAG: LapA family protein [Candidatus Rokubacteria bacterium]|nr:LapA family protein [Candidatus Rokubacteria bacterium]